MARPGDAGSAPEGHPFPGEGQGGGRRPVELNPRQVVGSAAVVVGLLVILGVAIILQGGGASDGDGDGDETVAAEQAAEEELAELGGELPGRPPPSEAWDLCEILTAEIAGSVPGMAMDLQESEGQSRDENCWYQAAGNEPVSFVPRVHLDSTGRTIYFCHREDRSECPVISEPVPSLPEGRISWHDRSERVSREPMGVWVQWEAQGRSWGLWYSDQRPREERVPVLQRRAELIAAAEEVHDRIVAGVGQP